MRGRGNSVKLAQVLKIAKKRAFVDAMLTATAASDIFTQDLGEDKEFNPPLGVPAETKK